MTNFDVFLDISNSSFVQFQIWDFPGQIDFFDPTFDLETIFGGCGALIFVIDAQVCTFGVYSTVNVNPYAATTVYIQACKLLIIIMACFDQ